MFALWYIVSQYSKIQKREEQHTFVDILVPAHKYPLIIEANKQQQQHYSLVDLSILYNSIFYHRSANSNQDPFLLTLCSALESWLLLKFVIHVSFQLSRRKSSFSLQWRTLQRGRFYSPNTFCIWIIVCCLIAHPSLFHVQPWMNPSTHSSLLNSLSDHYLVSFNISNLSPFPPKNIQSFLLPVYRWTFLCSKSFLPFLLLSQYTISHIHLSCYVYMYIMTVKTAVCF